LVVGDVFGGNNGLARHSMLPSIKDGDFGRKILGFEDNRRRKIRQRTVVRNFPLGLHRLSGFAKQD
jgi:hypothetical protein